VKVSILIPVYNEALTLPLVIQRVLRAPLPPGCEREVIVVDDGSTDGTAELLAQYKNSPLVVVHSSVLNFGKGAALRIGIAKATGDFILVQDGDLEYNPEADYLRMIEPLAAGGADIVYGSRFRRGVKGMKWANWIGNRILTFTANLLFGAGISDEATGYKAFRADVLRRVRLHCLRFEFCPEVTAKLLRAGYKIREVTISYNPRGILEGKKIRWGDGLQALWTLIRYRLAPLSSFVREASADAATRFAPPRLSN